MAAYQIIIRAFPYGPNQSLTAYKDDIVELVGADLTRAVYYGAIDPLVPLPTPPAELKYDNLYRRRDSGGLQWFDPETESWINVSLATAEELAELEASIPDLIATDESIQAAAATAADTAVTVKVTGLSLVLTTDLGAPRTATDVPTNYLKVEVDGANRVSRGIDKDGTQHLPKARVDALNGGVPALRSDPGMSTTGNMALDGSDLPALKAEVDGAGRASRLILPDGTQWFGRIQLGGMLRYDAGAGIDYIRGTVDKDGRMAEDFIDKAGNVPGWILARWKARMGITQTGVPPLDITPNAGQSNSTWADFNPSNVEDEEIDQWIYTWDGSNWVLMGSSPMSETFGMSFAREYARKHLVPGRGIGIVQCSEGSTGFSTSNTNPPVGAPAYVYYGNSLSGTWDRTFGAAISARNMYNEMSAKCLAAKAAAPAGSKFTDFLWSQGEADCFGIGATTYRTKLVDLFTQIRIDLSAPDMRIIVGGMNPNWLDDQSSGAWDIQGVLRDIPRLVPLSAYFEGPDNFPDIQSKIHWTSQGQHARGPLALEARTRARFNVSTVEPVPPPIVTATRFGGDLVVKWAHPDTHVDTFELQHRIDGGSWVNDSLGSYLTYEKVLTGVVTPTQKIEVRMRITNTVGTSFYTREVRA